MTVPANRVFLVFCIIALAASCKPRGYQSIPGCDYGWLLDPAGATLRASPKHDAPAVDKIVYGAKLLLCGKIKRDGAGRGRAGQWYFTSWPGNNKRAWLFSNRIARKPTLIETDSLKMRELLRLYWQAEGGLVILVGIIEPQTRDRSGNSFSVRKNGNLQFNNSGEAARIIKITYKHDALIADLKIWKSIRDGREHLLQSWKCTLARRHLVRAIHGLTRYSEADMSCRVITSQRTTEKAPANL